jgi:hypothetical protein
MKLLHWIGEHPILAVILVILFSWTLEDIVTIVVRR